MIEIIIEETPENKFKAIKIGAFFMRHGILYVKVDGNYQTINALGFNKDNKRFTGCWQMSASDLAIPVNVKIHVDSDGWCDNE